MLLLLDIILYYSDYCHGAGAEGACYPGARRQVGDPVASARLEKQAGDIRISQSRSTGPADARLRLLGELGSS